MNQDNGPETKEARKDKEGAIIPIDCLPVGGITKGQNCKTREKREKI